MPKLIFCLILFLLCTVPCTLHPSLAHAQGIEATTVYDIADKDAIDGDILISTDKGLVRAPQSYDGRTFGILQDQAVVVYRRVDNTGKPIVRSGMAVINVTTVNGSIKKGDYITTSDLPGKGQKAILSGYSIGIAMEDFDESTGEKIKAGEKDAVSGKLQVALKIEYIELSTSKSLSRSFDYLNTALFKNVQDPSRFVQIIRYVAAAIAIIVSFIIGFFTFSRSIPKGMEAIGRNPLAAPTIRFSIILNIIFTIVTALVGIIAAVAILKF